MGKLGLVMGALALSVVACGGDDDGAADEMTSVMISAAAGGTVTLGSASLMIPGGSLGADTTITVATTSPAYSLPAQDTLTGKVYDFGPDGTAFSAPATLTLPVTGSPTGGASTVISWLDTTTDAWVDATTTVSGGMASAPVSHFTSFIVRFAGGGLDTRDGTYDFSFVYNYNGTPMTVVLPQYFIVTNGVISSNPAELSGSVLDGFGNVEFSGPCPVGDGGAVFTGTLNLVNPLGGSGDWVCNVGGASNTWRAYNGQ
jgi:hypothetical protein